jgi:hypothetical protein
MRRALLLVGVTAALVVAAGILGTGKALAYGHADQPLAQVEVSANCDNPSFWLCTPAGVGGTGGIWYWVELDANGTGDLSGADCGHTVGGGGAGAGSIKGTASWTYTSLEAAPAGAIFFGSFDPNDQYYAVTITDGSTWLIPVSTGHYSAKLTNGVQVQITFAP